MLKDPRNVAEICHLYPQGRSDGQRLNRSIVVEEGSLILPPETGDKLMQILGAWPSQYARFNETTERLLALEAVQKEQAAVQEEQANEILNLKADLVDAKATFADNARLGLSERADICG